MSAQSIPLAELKSKDEIELTQELLPSSSRDSLDIDQELQLDHDQKFKIDRNFGMTLLVLWMGNFLCALDGTIVSTTMSNIASDFGQSDMVTWIATSYLLTSTAFQPLYGKTSDILGRKTLLLLAQGVFTLGIFLSALAVNVQTLAIARAVSGIGGAGILALASIIISDIVPLSQRSVFIGYGTIISSTSQMLGGPIGGLCIVTIGWRWMFLLQVPFLLTCMILLIIKVEINVEHIPDGEERYSRENLQRIDIGGIITLNLAVSSTIFLFSQTDNTTTFYRAFFSILLVISTMAYIYVERYVAVEKIIDPELLKGQIGVLGLSNGISALALYMVLFISPLYLQIVQDIPVTNIGYYTMFFVVSSALGSLIAGFLIRKHDKSEIQTMVASVDTSCKFFVLQTFGFIILFVIVNTTVPDDSSLLWKILFIIGLVISGTGAGGYGVGVVIFIIGKVGRKGQASANTVVSLIRQLGNVLGVSISLSSYTNDVSWGLHHYFAENKEFTQKLIADSGYIRSGLPEEYIGEVLHIYKRGIIQSFVPSLVLTLAGLIVLLMLNKKVKLMSSE
jgi:MFS family permease